MVGKMMTLSEPFLTPTEAARVARVSAETIRRAIRSGRLPALKRLGSTRHWIERQALDRWVKGECAAPALHSSMALADLMQQLPNLPTFQGDPVEIQQALRDEWR